MEKVRINKYKRWYDCLINKRINNVPEGYTEIHHILPKCIGGTNDKHNLVRLTAREHYIAHLLLTKMYINDRFIAAKMIRAYVMMAWTVNFHRKESYKKNSKTYELLKKAFAKIQHISQKGETNNNFNNVWIFNLELKQSKLVNKSYVLEEGWSYGRVINWQSFLKKRKEKERVVSLKKEKKTCIHCKEIFTSERKKNFCSLSCSNAYNYKTEPNFIEITKDNFIKKIKRENFSSYKKIGWRKVT